MSIHRAGAPEVHPGRTRRRRPAALADRHVRDHRAELAADDAEDVLTHFSDLRTQLPDVAVETELAAAHLASGRGEIGHGPEAADLVRDAVERVDVATPASALVALLRTARCAEARVAAEVTTRALAHPGLPLAVRRELGGGVALTPALAGADSLGGSR